MYIHTHIPTYLHTYIHTYDHTRISPHIPPHLIHTHCRIHTHLRTHACYDPRPQIYFTEEWFYSFSLSLRNFLSLLFENLPLPRAIALAIAAMERRGELYETKYAKTELERLRCVEVGCVRTRSTMLLRCLREHCRKTKGFKRE